MTSTCACLNARRLARLLTRLYDRALGPAGIRATQLPLLAMIGLRGTTTVTVLADAVVMDQTTVTRGLSLLERRGWIKSAVGTDLRTREVSLTGSGWVALERAIPLWDRAQAQVEHVIGEVGARRLLASVAGTVDQMQGRKRSRIRGTAQ